MTSIFSKEKRIIYKRKMRGFYDEYRQTKIGVFGLLMLCFFVFISILAPYIAPYPEFRMPVVAANFAMPEWVSIFPGYGNLPRTTNISIQEMEISQSSAFVDILQGDSTSLNYTGASVDEVGVVRLSKSFTYQYQPPKEFLFSATYVASNIKNMQYASKVVLTDSDGKDWVIIEETKRINLSYARWIVPSTSGRLRRELFGNVTTNPARAIFANKGNYTLSLDITFQPRSTNATGTINLKGGSLIIWGALHGVLGTDSFGRDVYSQILYGASMSITVGLLTAVVTMSIATVVGMTAGYFGGKVDAVLMRIVDIVMILPLFVILLILIRNFKLNIIFTMILISCFFWAGPARTIRSRILSLKERTFVENAKAAGGTGFYIIRRHLFPNIIPLSMASLILFVPVGILMESTLSFLGFGDPTSFTWGKILAEARVSGGFSNLAWWYVLSPGLAIILLCLSFVFIGHALDAIVNPRLRRR